MGQVMDRSCRTTRCLKIALMAVSGIAVLGLIVMLLWNWLMPALFVGAQPVSYWQALGILLLAKILFGGGHRPWKSRRREPVTAPEQEALKARFAGRWRGCCGSRQGDTSAPSTAE